ncbi:hypothetical protein [Puniceicoccus vermicola]|uniref:Uncharacterized protein n=1 Tax=Puniceicoccus vermicola TaxID=388746 RepID=A0A7X1AYU2_9BACT|nr:hypothetical protein [Puniceicoccus vermicola]MBC2602491.1 hypothetical protein [Puniceicoccus vermicola]
MADSSENSSDKNESLDLEQLRDLSFAPQWSSGGSSGSSQRSREERPKSRSSGPARDRRPARKRPSSGAPGGGGGGGPRGKRGERPARPEPYRPIVNFSIYPEDEPFDLLTQSIRSSLKVYELFEVTQLILDKPDRMVVVVTPLSDEAPPLYECLPDRQLFRDETTALMHAANLLLPSVFEEKEEDVDPPSGNFSSVLRCKFSGKYLPPKSYHRYQALLQEHQRLNCPDISIERVESGLEPVAEEEAVQEWLKSMSRRSVFRLRSASAPVEAAKPEEAKPEEETPVADGEAPKSEEASAPEAGTETPAAEEAPAPTPEAKAPAEDALVLDSREAALNHLIRTKREKLVRETRQARVPARALAEAEDSEIQKSFAAYVEQQKRFPLDSANNVRMKLRKGKFFIFKKGKKGISYVSAVRRKHRPQNSVFADSVEKIISLLEANPEIKLKTLPGLLYPERVDESGKANLEPDETRQIVKDLKWLKSEGYLYEYGDGTLEMHSKEIENPKGSSGPKPAPEAQEPAEEKETTEESPKSDS